MQVKWPQFTILPQFVLFWNVSEIREQAGQWLDFFQCFFPFRGPPDLSLSDSDWCLEKFFVIILLSFGIDGWKISISTVSLFNPCFLDKYFKSILGTWIIYPRNQDSWKCEIEFVVVSLCLRCCHLETSHHANHDDKRWGKFFPSVEVNCAMLEQGRRHPTVGLELVETDSRFSIND